MWNVFETGTILLESDEGKKTTVRVENPNYRLKTRFVGKRMSLTRQSLLSPFGHKNHPRRKFKFDRRFVLMHGVS